MLSSLCCAWLHFMDATTNLYNNVTLDSKPVQSYWIVHGVLKLAEIEPFRCVEWLYSTCDVLARGSCMLSASHLLMPSFLGVFGLLPSNLSISVIILGVNLGKYCGIKTVSNYSTSKRSKILLHAIWAATWDFQHCGILTSVDSEKPVQPPFKLRNSKYCSVSSLTLIEYSSD